jgi:hypothetical protein
MALMSLSQREGLGTRLHPIMTGYLLSKIARSAVSVSIKTVCTARSGTVMLPHCLITTHGVTCLRTASAQPLAKSATALLSGTQKVVEIFKLASFDGVCVFCRWQSKATCPAPGAATKG